MSLALTRLLGALLVCALVSCASTDYGGKQVAVAFSIEPPLDVSVPDWAPEDAWVLDTRSWLDLDAKVKLADLNALRREGKSAEADALLAELSSQLDRKTLVRIRRAESKERVPMTTLFLVVLHDGVLPSKEFDATVDRKVRLAL